MFSNPGQSAATPRARGDIRGGCSWVCRGAAGLWGERMDGTHCALPSPGLTLRRLRNEGVKSLGFGA